MAEERIDSLAIADAYRDCVRSLLSCAHACIAASDAFRAETTSPGRSASIRLCNEVAGRCLALHAVLTRPESADMVSPLFACDEACRQAETICHVLADVHWLCGAAAAACRRCGEACRDLAWRLRDDAASGAA